MPAGCRPDFWMVFICPTVSAAVLLAMNYNHDLIKIQRIPIDVFD